MATAAIVPRIETSKCSFPFCALFSSYRSFEVATLAKLRRTLAARPKNKHLPNCWRPEWRFSMILVRRRKLYFELNALLRVWIFSFPFFGSTWSRTLVYARNVLRRSFQDQNRALSYRDFRCFYYIRFKVSETRRLVSTWIQKYNSIDAK